MTFGFVFQSSVGGRITVMQTNLPTVGPGSLHNREDATQQAAKVSEMLKGIGQQQKCSILLSTSKNIMWKKKYCISCKGSGLQTVTDLS